MSRYFLIILFYLTGNGVVQSQSPDSSFSLVRSLDFHFGSFILLSHETDYNNEREVNVRPGRSPYFGMSASFYIDNLYTLSVYGGFNFPVFRMQYKYIDSNNEIGYDFSDEPAVMGIFGNFDISASRKIYNREGKSRVSLGAGITMLYQDRNFSYETQMSLGVTPDSSKLIFEADFNATDMLPGIAPRIFADIDLTRKAKRVKMSLLLNYNFCRRTMINGEFKIYTGNNTFSEGKFSVRSHFISAGLRISIHEKERKSRKK
jgi:hypothetical protein